MVKVRIKAGTFEFEGEGDAKWIGDQLDKVLERLGDIGSSASGSEGGQDSTAQQSQNQHHNDKMSAAEIIRKASPASNPERAVVLAYWIEQYKGKSKWSTSDITSAFDEAKLKAPTNPAETIRGTVRKGHVHGSGSTRSLTQTGEEWVKSKIR